MDDHVAPPAGRRDRSRRALMDAGEVLMSGGLISAVSIDDIAAKASVSKGTFYNHFADREALFAAIVAAVRAELRFTILDQTRELDDAARKMARGFCVGLRYQLSHRHKAIFLTQSHFVLNSVHDQLNVGIVGFVAEGIASGRFLLPTAEAGVLLMHGLSQAAFAQSAHDADAFATVARGQQLTALLLRGLGLGFAEADQIAGQEADLILRPAFA